MEPGRPKDSAPQSYQKLYARFQQGPLWLEDWKSTGLARSTVHLRLKFLSRRGLIKSRRNGKRIEYYLPKKEKSEILNLDDIKWHNLMYPYSRKQERQLMKKIFNTAKEYRKITEIHNQSFLQMEVIFKAIDRVLDDPESQIVIKTLEKIGIDYKDIPISNLLRGLIVPNQIGTLCIDCLEKGILCYLVTAQNPDEIVCPLTGIVKRVELKDKEAKTIRPYAYRRLFG
jgi:hypothetical protein